MQKQKQTKTKTKKHNINWAVIKLHSCVHVESDYL